MYGALMAPRSPLGPRSLDLVQSPLGPKALRPGPFFASDTPLGVRALRPGPFFWLRAPWAPDHNLLNSQTHRPPSS